MKLQKEWIDLLQESLFLDPAPWASLKQFAEVNELPFPPHTKWLDVIQKFIDGLNEQLGKA